MIPPDWDNDEEPGEWFCRRCVAEWTRRIQMATVRTGVSMTRSAFRALAKRVDVDGVTNVTIRMTTIEDDPALIAELHHEEQRDSWVERLLVVNDGVVKLS